MSQLELKPLPPKDAIAYLQSKGLQTGFDYRDVWQEEHGKAFTIAGVMQLGLLQDVQALTVDALQSGITFASWQKAFVGALKEHGADKPFEVVDEKTGRIKTVNLMSTRRQRIIFSTNVRQAYNFGNWQRAWQTRADLPYMIYHHNDVRFPRPEHEAWDLVCLPIEHPWWRTHYPQCAWGCKCSTESASKSMLVRMGLKVTADSDIPKFPISEYVNKRTGEVSQVEQGIDPSFNYNVGTAPLRAITARPEQIAANRPVKDIDALTQPFFDAAGASPDAKEPVTDKGGWPVAINRLLFEDASGKPALPNADTQLLPLAGETLRAPDSVTWRWSSEIRAQADKVAMDATISDAYRSARPTAEAWLDRPNPLLVEAAARQGIDIAGLRHKVTSQELRHIDKRHGPDSEATRNGSLAVTADDMRLIPEMMRTPDGVIFGTADDRGQPAITFLKQREDSVLIYTVTIHPNRRALISKTMVKRSPGTDFEALRTQLRANVQNGREDTRTLVDLRGQINRPKDIVVRRYTKRIDNRRVTVDFSTDGTWTYEVVPEAPLKTP